MFEVRRTFCISAAHKLDLPYESKCRQLHGHNWRITVICRSERLNEEGMVIDFSHIKRVADRLDHTELNLTLPTICSEVRNPTAENIAFAVAQFIGPICTEVRVEESDGSVAIWSK